MTLMEMDENLLIKLKSLYSLPTTRILALSQVGLLEETKSKVIVRLSVEAGRLQIKEFNYFYSHIFFSLQIFERRLLSLYFSFSSCSL